MACPATCAHSATNGSAGRITAMLKNSKGPELPAWVFLALRLGSLLVVAVAAVFIARCNG